MKYADDKLLLLALDGDGFGERYASFKQLLSREHKAHIAAKHAAEEQHREGKTNLSAEVNDAASLMRNSVSGCGHGLNSWRSSLAFPSWSQLLHFTWIPPVLDFVKAVV